MLRLEYMVVAAVFGVAVTVILERALYYQEIAEKTAMEITVMNLRTGLRYRVAELMLHNRMQEMGEVAAENPVKWLDAPPPGYLGALRVAQAGDVGAGSWYFDTERRQLCYRVNLSRHFAARDGGKEVCYRTVPLAGRVRDGHAELEGVALELAKPYRWF